jgi:hypothetical protein
MMLGAPILFLAAAAAPNSYVWAAANAPDKAMLALVGQYDGGQMELASALELTKDGHFRYIMSYGAVDEFASGTWTVANGMVMLTVQQFESADPSATGFPSMMKIEDGQLLLPRYDRVIKFRKK